MIKTQAKIPTANLIKTKRRRQQSMAKKVKVGGHFRTTPNGRRIHVRAQIRAAVTSAPKKPSAKKPLAKKPSAKKPAANKPAAKKPSAKKPSAKKPSAKKP